MKLNSALKKKIDDYFNNVTPEYLFEILKGKYGLEEDNSWNNSFEGMSDCFISNLILQSGYSPVILPSINFVNLAKEKEEKEKGTN